MSAAFPTPGSRRADVKPSAAGGAGASAVAVPRPKILPLPVLRQATKYNAQVFPISSFDVSKLGFAPAASGDYYKDGMDGISVPLTYNGEYAMNYGWYVPHGRFDLLESVIKGDKQVQLMANYAVHTVAEGVAIDADARKKDMFSLLSSILAVEDKAKKTIVDDVKGTMFGVAFGASELESKTRMDGKLEKGKFSSLVYAGANKSTGDAAFLKSYFKMPLIEGERLYCTLTLNGAIVDAPDLATWLEAVNWKNDVGIVLSFRDLYKCTHGISVRVRIDTVGVREPPKPAYVPLYNPFAAGSSIIEDS
jgi:hypothetical protein